MLTVVYTSHDVLTVVYISHDVLTVVYISHDMLTVVIITIYKVQKMQFLISEYQRHHETQQKLTPYSDMRNYQNFQN